MISSALLPQPYPSTVNKPWWSYDIGIVHVMGMSTEHDYRVGSDQYNWLVHALLYNIIILYHISYITLIYHYVISH